MTLAVVMIAASAQGLDKKPGQTFWTLSAVNPAGIQYKMASGPWLNLGESRSAVVLPINVKAGENGLRLTGIKRTIDVAPQTTIKVTQSTPDRLEINLEAGGVIYDLQTKGQINVTVADKVLVVAESSSPAFPGQADQACTGGVLFMKPDMVQTRNLQGNVSVTDFDAHEKHLVNPGNLLSMDLGKKSISVQNDSSSIKMIASEPPAAEKPEKSVTVVAAQEKAPADQTKVTAPAADEKPKKNVTVASAPPVAEKPENSIVMVAAQEKAPADQTNAPAPVAAEKPVKKVKKGEIQVRNLQGAVTYTEPDAEENAQQSVIAGQLFAKNLSTGKVSTRDDSQDIFKLTKAKNNKLGFFGAKSPWEMLADGAVSEVSGSSGSETLGVGEGSGAAAITLIVKGKPDQVEYQIADGATQIPTENSTAVNFPIKIKTKDAVVRLSGQDFLIEVGPDANFQLDQPKAHQFMGVLETGAVFYEIHSTIEIKVKDYAVVRSESAPRVFAALPEMGNVGGVLYREKVAIGFFGVAGFGGGAGEGGVLGTIAAQSPWVIGGAVAIVAGGAGGIAWAVSDNNNGGGGHGRSTHHEASSSKPE